jgi:large subunit ribosomal protein L3
MAMAAASIGGALGFLAPRRRGVSFPGAVGARRRPPLAVVRAASYEAGVGVMATKVGMMTYFDPANGKPVPVTVVGFRDGGNVVTQVKTAATDGYDSVQVGYHGVREDKLTRPELGHLGKAGAPALRHLQEFRLVAVDAFDPGQELEFNELFKEGDLVDVSAKSIGKGFQGQQCLDPSVNSRRILKLTLDDDLKV